MGFQKIPLDVAASVVLDSSGNGTVTIGPQRLLQTWVPNNAAVNVTSNTKEPTVNLYLGPARPANLLAASYTGSNDSTPLDVTLRSGNFLTAVWAGGDVGARATLSLYGEILVGRP